MPSKSANSITGPPLCSDKKVAAKGDDQAY
jgi:hypothetical protein